MKVIYENKIRDILFNDVADADKVFPMPKSAVIPRHEGSAKLQYYFQADPSFVGMTATLSFSTIAPHSEISIQD